MTTDDFKLFSNLICEIYSFLTLGQITNIHVNDNLFGQDYFLDVVFNILLS